MTVGLLAHCRALLLDFIFRLCFIKQSRNIWLILKVIGIYTSIRLRYFGSKAFVVKALSPVFAKRAFGRKQEASGAPLQVYSWRQWKEFRDCLSVSESTIKAHEDNQVLSVVGGARGVSVG
jgi:hypothetical protein